MGSDDAVRVLVDHFNARYQMFGRTIQVVDLAFPSTEAQLTALVSEATRLNLFAVLDVSTTPWAVKDSDAFLVALARAGIVGVVGKSYVHEDATLTDHGPYPWSVYPTYETRHRAGADFICSALKDRPVAASPAYAGQPRKFGIVYGVDEGLKHPKPATLVAELRKCGIDAPTYEFSFGTDQTSRSRDQATVERMKRDGVTTGILGNHGFTFHSLHLVAMKADYRPEWVTPAAETFSQVYALSSSVATALGPVMDTPTEEGRSKIAEQILRTEGEMSTAKMRTQLSVVYGTEAYRAMKLLASGIQGAGPTLTPETFAAGLEGQRFPNPGAGAAPYFQSAISFALGDHAEERDYGVVWTDMRRKDQIPRPRPGHLLPDRRGSPLRRRHPVAHRRLIHPRQGQLCMITETRILDNGLTVCHPPADAAAGGGGPGLSGGLARRAPRTDRLRPPLRAPDVPGVHQRCRGRVLGHARPGRRQPQRHDPRRPDRLPRDRPRGGVGAGAVGRGRPDGRHARRTRPARARQRARGGEERAPAELGGSALRRRLGASDGRLLPRGAPLPGPADRLDGRHRRRRARRRQRLLPPPLRPQQLRARPGGRRDPRAGLRPG